MKHLDLFSGIGGFALAASWVWGAEHEIHSFVEIEPFCQKVLKKHWPNVPIHGDVTTYEHDGTAIDLLTGGFPCQPFSQAGKRRGKKDDRFLWPAMLEIIKASSPRWIIGENVAGIVNLALKQAILDLEGCGYWVELFNIPAFGVNSPHKRERIWIVAYTSGVGLQEIYKHLWEHVEEPPKIRGLSGHRRWLGEPEFERVVDGIPNQLDRLKALGNAIVPQVVAPIMQAIKTIEYAQYTI